MERLLDLVNRNIKMTAAIYNALAAIPLRDRYGRDLSYQPQADYHALCRASKREARTLNADKRHRYTIKVSIDRNRPLTPIQLKVIGPDLPLAKTREFAQDEEIIQHFTKAFCSHPKLCDIKQTLITSLQNKESFETNVEMTRKEADVLDSDYIVVARTAKRN